MFSFISFTSFILILSSISLGTELRINNTDDFVEFAHAVNSGTSYAGTTVLLDADIDFTKKHTQQEFEVIGNDTLNFFSGVFDGQGHTVRDFKLTTASKYAGLFGYSEGLAIKNLVLDASYAVASTSEDANSFVGGLLGQCHSPKGACSIEGVASMAGATFKGTAKQTLYLGGLVGYLYAAGSASSLVGNAANYGTVTHSGKSRYSYVGGLAGRCDGYSAQGPMVSVRNVLNYGTVAHLGATTSWLHLGGIAGHAYYSAVDNALSHGAIAYSGESTYVGSIAGNAFAAHFAHCYWGAASKYAMCGAAENTTAAGGARYDEGTLRLLEPVSVGGYAGDSLVEALNAGAAYHALDNYARWAANAHSAAVSFTVNGGESALALSSRVLLLPSLASDGALWFDGWYTDSACATPFAAAEIGAQTALYGRWARNTNAYTVAFSTRGASPVEPAPITAQYLSVVALPAALPKYRKCRITAWETDRGYAVPWNFTVPARNITLYAALLCTYIASAEEFARFAANVSAGMNYSGTTVYLDADVDLAGVPLDPIGQSERDMFAGTFDGQGHVLSNLEVNSTLAYAGLFGYSRGLTLRNLVLDASCAVLRDGKTPHAYVGGLLAYCTATAAPCTVESVVSMAAVTFAGEAGYYLYLGGLAGDLDSTYVRDCVVQNSANYGTVTNAGASTFSRTGGIVGFSRGYSALRRVYIRNCLNHGAVLDEGSTKNNVYVGGATGDCRMCTVEACVNDAPLAATAQSSWIGAIAGGVTTAEVALSYWTSAVGCPRACGAGTVVVDNETALVELGAEVLAKLNNYSDAFSRNGWVLAASSNVSVSFTLNNGNELALRSRVLVLPDPAESGERAFSGWFRDAALEEPFADDVVEADTRLYGMLCAPNYTVALDVNGGDPVSLAYPTVDVECNRPYGALPTPARPGYAFLGWFTERAGGDKIESGDKAAIINDHTLFAQWTPGTFTVTLDVNGGDELATKEVTVMFGEKYGTLPTPNRSGHVFLGWFTDESEPVTEDTTVRVPGNHTLHAHWKETPSDKVEIVFVSKGLGRKEAEDFARRYTAAEFRVLKYTNDEPEGVRIVLKFADVADAVSFVETVRAASEAMGAVKRIGFTFDESFSPVLSPALFFGVFI